MNNPWANLQEAIAVRLRATDGFGDVPVVTEDVGDIGKAIDAALARGASKTGTTGKAGLAVLVLTPRGEGVDSSAGHVLCDTTAEITVFEKVGANRSSLGTQKPALDVVFAAAGALNGWRVYPGMAPGRFERFDSVQDPESGVLAYSVFFVFRQSIPV